MFLLAAFLLVPMLFFLFARLFFVIRVLETIIYLPYIEIQNLNLRFRSKFLPIFCQIVKVYMVALVKFHVLAMPIPNTLTLSIGQVIEIATPSVRTFAIGNKDVISVKYEESRQKLVIKAKSLGYTDLKLWGEKSKTIKVYILSKTRQLKLLEVQAELRHFRNLRTSIRGGKIHIAGSLHKRSDYRIFHEFMERNKKYVFAKVSLSDELRRNIIGDIYYRFFNNLYDEISCDNEGHNILCSTSPHIMEDKKFITQLKNRFFVNFNNSVSFKKSLNYQIEMRLIQIEMLNGKEVKLGLDNINISLAEILENGTDAIKNLAGVRLSQTEMNISTLAKPKASITLGELTTLKVGSDIPYTLNSFQNGPSNLKWKFAGLKVKLKVNKKNNFFQVKYETELTRPIQSSDKVTMISGNTQASTFNIKRDVPIQAFEIAMKTIDNQKKNIPVLGQIPVLKELFSSNAKFSTHKKIIAIFRLTATGDI